MADALGMDTASVTPAPTPTFGWGDALVAASKIAEASANMRAKQPQAPGLGGVQGLGTPASAVGPFAGGMPRPQIRPPGGIGSALIGGR